MLNRTLYKIDKVILVASFILVIFVPLISGILQEDKTASNTEKRNLEKLPALPDSIEALIQFPKLFNQYYSDHFGFREELTRAYFKTTSKLGKQSTLDDVTFGKQDWLFLGGTKPGYTNYGDPVGNAMNVKLFTQKELENYVAPLVAIDDWLKQQDIEFLFVIAPNKHSIYFDKLPSFITKKNELSAIDQLLTYIREHTDITTVDLRPALIDGRKEHEVYYKSDTHWNHYGANIAQYEIMKTIGKMFPGKITPSLLTDDQFEMNILNDGDLAKFAGIESFSEPSPVPVFEDACNTYIETHTATDTGNYTTTCTGQQLQALVYRDSFFITLQPYFSKKFSRITYIQERISKPLLMIELDKNRPDIVISEVVERAIP